MTLEMPVANVLLGAFLVAIDFFDLFFRIVKSIYAHPDLLVRIQT